MKISQSSRCRLLGMAIVLFMGILVLPLSACREEVPETGQVADYGPYGSRFAFSLARQYPNRSPGSTQERQAGNLIIRALTETGYSPEVTTFFFTDDEGTTRSSRNISVTIPGVGFVRTDADGNTGTIRRQVIVGAHYDTFISAEAVEAWRLTVEPTPTATPTPTAAAGDPDQEPGETTRFDTKIIEPTLADYDGIHDNASGVGVLITLAREIRTARLGYDVVLVAFGAGEAGQAGSYAYVDRMSKADIARTDVMYCIESIYAGDKIYAHAGQNSVRSYYRKSYELRRKLYEVTDVFYEYELYTNNNYMLYTNQCGFDVTIDGVSTPVLYREWTLTASDYLPFDEQGIPIVFFESYDYDGKKIEDLKESKNPAFSSTEGAIRHTAFDSATYLNLIMNQRRTVRTTTPGAGEAQTVDHLTKRINNTAFIILEAIRKGLHDAETTPDSQAVTPAAP